MWVKLKGFLLLPLLLLIVRGDKDREWWENTIYYQIIPRSFMDSNGDGIGDIIGMTSRLEYLKELGVGATWITPVYKSSHYDMGYDVTDYYDIDEDYGTMEDFENFLARARELDIKVILDFVPNHTSNESEWFQEALKGNDTYYNYYVWEDGVVDENGTLRPPNNWVSVFRRSAWGYKEEVGKYYLHQIMNAEPDLNYRNPEVVEEIKNVLRFWLDKGIAGYRIGAGSHLFEVDKELYGGRYPDEPRTFLTDDPDDHDYVDHIYTKNLDESYDMIFQWREIFDEYKERDGFTRVIMTEAYATPQQVVRYFGEGDCPGVQIPSNYVLISDVTRGSTAAEIKRAVDEFVTFKPINQHANWLSGNHDQARVTNRFGTDLVDGFNMLVLLLPGIAITYMGEELGMLDGYVSWEDTLDPAALNTEDPINYWRASRDPGRTPFQWSSEVNAGFSTAPRTWLPVAAGYETLNVQVQSEAERSHLKVYKTLARLRTEDVFRYGRYESVAFNTDVFAFRRWHNGENYIIVVNFRNSSHTVDLTYFDGVSEDVEVIVTNTMSPKTPGDIIQANRLQVVATESLVLATTRNSAMALVISKILLLILLVSKVGFGL